MNKPGYTPFFDALCPIKGRSGERRTVWFKDNDIQKRRVHSPWTYANVITAMHSLRSPLWIRRCIRSEPELWNGYCFAARPDRMYNEPGEDVPFQDGCVFLVFVTDETFVVFDWRIEFESVQGSGEPDRADERFGEHYYP